MALTADNKNAREANRLIARAHELVESLEDSSFRSEITGALSYAGDLLTFHEGDWDEEE